MTIFHKDGDYTAFLDLLAAAKKKFSVKVFGLCLMPNHFHLVVQPANEATLSPFMQWWMTTGEAIRKVACPLFFSQDVEVSKFRPAITRQASLDKLWAGMTSAPGNVTSKLRLYRYRKVFRRLILCFESV